MAMLQCVPCRDRNTGSNRNPITTARLHQGSRPSPNKAFSFLLSAMGLPHPHREPRTSPQHHSQRNLNHKRHCQSLSQVVLRIALRLLALPHLSLWAQFLTTKIMTTTKAIRAIAAPVAAVHTPIGRFERRRQTKLLPTIASPPIRAQSTNLTGQCSCGRMARLRRLRILTFSSVCRNAP